MAAALDAGSGVAVGAVGSMLLNHTQWGRAVRDMDRGCARALGELGLGCLAGATEVALGLEEAKQVLLSGACEAAADVIEHRYGADAGSSARRLVGILQSLYRAKQSRGHCKMKYVVGKYARNQMH